MATSVTSKARMPAVKDVVDAISQQAFPISPRDIVKCLPQECEWVLLGEASHGTKEFYQVCSFLLLLFQTTITAQSK